MKKKKTTIAIPAYKDTKHASQQALASQRMPARIYKDRKKESRKRACRNERMVSL